MKTKSKWHDDASHEDMDMSGNIQSSQLIVEKAADAKLSKIAVTTINAKAADEDGMSYQYQQVLMLMK